MTANLVAQAWYLAVNNTIKADNAHHSAAHRPCFCNLFSCMGQHPISAYSGGLRDHHVFPPKLSSVFSGFGSYFTPGSWSPVRRAVQPLAPEKRVNSLWENNNSKIKYNRQILRQTQQEPVIITGNDVDVPPCTSGGGWTPIVVHIPHNLC
jgi:hypothetical protein